MRIVTKFVLQKKNVIFVVGKDGVGLQIPECQQNMKIANILFLKL